MWLVQIRGKKSQTVLAEELGVSQNYLSKIELGRRDPSVQKAKDMAKKLGVPWMKFFETDSE